MKIDRMFGIGMVVVALLFVVFGVPTISDEWQKAAGTQYFTVGPRLFPYIAGSLCGLLGAVLALHPEGRNSFASLRDKTARRNVVLSIGLSFLYAAVLNVLGFIVATCAALLLFFLIFRERRWYVILPIIVGVPIFVNYVFLKFFMLEMPTGLIELPV